MKEIQLTQSQVALVDDDLYEELNQVKWNAHKDGKTFYGRRWSPMVNGKRHIVLMHHVILGRPPKGFVTDHINGCGIDNRRKNLRFVTNRQNGQNNKNCKKSSQYPGVYWDKEYKKWRVCIRINGKTKNLGRFTDEKAAFEAYKKAVNELGETIVGEI